MLTNPMFMILLAFMMAGQILITQFGNIVFGCNPKGLDGKQWAICFGLGFTSFAVDFILKFIPDWLVPKVGKDSVDDRRRAASMTQNKSSDSVV